MAKKTKKIFWLVVPLLLFLAAGILTKTTNYSLPGDACSAISLNGDATADAFGYFQNKKVAIPQVAGSETNQVLGVADPNDKWIEVDLSEQKLKAWDGNQLFLETLVSTGLPWWPTPTGEFNIWVKLRATRMEGGSGRYYYNLPNVPFVMYFGNAEVPNWRGFGLHGTYWHNDFGRQHSHGCVNLPTPVAQKLYYWTTPVLPEGKGIVFASDDNPGTRIVIHQ